MSGAALFVAGTDTGAGKTFAAAALCRALRARGLRVGVFKPAESGCDDPSRPADALALREAAGCAAPLELVCPYRLRAPLAPAVAARWEKIEIDPRLLDRCLEELRAQSDLVVCEGAGGLLVPLANGLLTADWIESRRLAVLLVGRLGLGTVNHTLLSACYLRDRGIAFLGTVLSATERAAGPAEETNPTVLGGFAEVRLLGVLPYGERPQMPPAAVEAALALVGPARDEGRER